MDDGRPGKTPGKSGVKALLLELFAIAVAAAQPTHAIKKYLPRPPKGRTIVLGAGKAAGSMALAVEEHFPGPLQGQVIVPDGYGRPCKSIKVVEASHPVPDARGLKAASEILDLAKAAGPDDLVLFLISGGASSLMVSPAAGVELAEKRALTTALLRSGASIVEMNCVRKHLSAVKGGRLAAAAAPARAVTLIISDVVGDDPSVIASGPTVVDTTTCADALDVLSRYHITVPDHILEALRTSTFETPKNLPPAKVDVIARPRESLDAAAVRARAAGYAIHDLGDERVGEAREEAHTQAELVRAILAGRGPVKAPCILMSGGELVVTMRGQGRGGPNTEFALAFAKACEDLDNVWLLAADTDGADGASGAAGALVEPGVMRAARAEGFDPDAALAENDSAGYFAARGALVNPGPTFTNVNDFRAVLIL